MRNLALVTLASALALGGCNNRATDAAGNTATSAGTATENGMSSMGDAAGNGMSTMGNGIVDVGNTQGVNKTQDATAGVVGAMGANLPRTAEGFATNAALSDMYEIEASKMALERTKSPEIKTYAHEMITDHTKTTAKLKPAAKAAGLTPPTELDNRRQGMVNNLKTAGMDFDKTYVTQQVASHKEALDLMQNYAAHGDNPGLKTVAASAVPIVQHHYDMAKAMEATPK